MPSLGRRDLFHMRAIFLDRDGVINKNREDYVRSLEDFEYYSFTGEAIEALGKIGLPLVVVTNQSAIARQLTTEKEVLKIHKKLRTDAEGWGAPILAIEYCPHHPSDLCHCRKPGTSLFEKVAREHDLQFTGSYLVGDAPSDIEAGQRLSMITIRVATGRGSEESDDMPQPDWQVPDLLAAALRIAQLEGIRCDR